MTGTGGPDRRGAHPSAAGAAGSHAGDGFQPSAIGGFAPGHEAPRYEPSRYEPSRFSTSARQAAGRSAEPSRHSFEVAERVTSGISRSRPGDLHPDATGPVDPARWSAGDVPARAARARHGGDGPARPDESGSRQLGDTEHPSAPLPPRPAGVWGRLSPRHDGPDDETVASPLLPAPPVDGRDDRTDAHPVDPGPWEDLDGDHDPDLDRTGGLEVIGAHVEDDHTVHLDQVHADGPHGDGVYGDGVYGGGVYGDVRDDDIRDDDIPLAPYDPRGGGRRRRRPLAVLLSLLVLAGLVVGIVVGGQQLLNLVNPSAEDFAGQGSGEVDVQVREGDTLSDIARTLVDAGVVASVGAFVDAAEAEPDATGIQPGVYSLRQEMSGQAALDLLLDPAARQVSRVTVPEGLTVAATLARLAESTGASIEELNAAAADPAALGLPAYANGQLEGFLFPATYEFQPDTAPADMLRQMVAQFTEVADRLQLEQRAAARGLSPYEVVTIASMIQSETRLDEERPDVAQVIYNRLAQGIPLGIDAALAYGLDKNGNELTVTDLQTDSPYNTRTRQGLPPTPISAPGELSLEAALSPSVGTLLYYVLESADGTHFFTDDYDEFLAARQRCAAAGLGCGG